MSGPKVVRIVTREELVAACNAHLARLDAAIRQWTKTGQRNEVLADSDIATVTGRRDQIAQLLKADKFMEVQKQAPLEIDFLKRDTQIRLELAAKRVFETRQRDRRNGEAGRVLLAALEKVGQDIPNDLRRTLENASGEGIAIDAAFSQAFGLLNPDRPGKVTDLQSHLAAYYGEGEARQMFPDWLAKQANAYTATFHKLDIALSELGTIGDSATVATFAQRAEGLASQPVDDRTPLLVDSLVIDIRVTLKAARVAKDLFDQLALLEAEVAHFPDAKARIFLTRIEMAVESRDIEATKELVADVGAWLDEQKRATTAAARREAMLKGLSELGYAVNDGLETVWAQDGKVVLRKASSPDYGVEISESCKPLWLTVAQT